MFRLRTPVTYNEKVRGVSIENVPDADVVCTVAAPCYALGWGKKSIGTLIPNEPINWDTHFPRTLQKALVKLVTPTRNDVTRRESCNNRFHGRFFRELMICTEGLSFQEDRESVERSYLSLVSLYFWLIITSNIIYCL